MYRNLKVNIGIDVTIKFFKELFDETFQDIFSEKDAWNRVLEIEIKALLLLYKVT